MGQNRKNAFVAALATFVAFIVVGFIPLMSFVFDFGSANYQTTIILTAVAFALIGYIKGYVTGKSKGWSALQTFGIGALAALIAFYVGYILAFIVN